jgi:quercetin dioxygenase-like cupin family protein
VEREERQIWPGDAIHIRPGIDHMIVNTGEELLSLVGCLVIDHWTEGAISPELATQCP